MKLRDWAVGLMGMLAVNVALGIAVSVPSWLIGKLF